MENKFVKFEVAETASLDFDMFQNFDLYIRTSNPSKDCWAECYDRSGMEKDLNDYLHQYAKGDKPVDIGKLMAESDVLFHISAGFQPTGDDSFISKEPRVLLVAEMSEESGGSTYTREVPLSDEEKKLLSEMPEMKELLGVMLRNAMEAQEGNKAVTMPVSDNIELVGALWNPSNDGLRETYSMSVRNTESGEWLASVIVSPENIPETMCEIMECGADMQKYKNLGFAVPEQPESKKSYSEAEM